MNLFAFNKYYFMMITRNYFLYLVACAALTLTACGNKQTGNENSKDVDSTALETVQDTLVSENEMTYFPAIRRYLVNQLGSQYSPGEYCVPFQTVIDVDEKNDDDILVWGDFWVFNYNQVGDTLKTVSGGSHPGLMHIRQTDSGYEVFAFDQVADGAGYQKSAKQIFGERYEAFQAVNSDAERRERHRKMVLSDYVKNHNIPVAMYQDYGWQAVNLQ